MQTDLLIGYLIVQFVVQTLFYYIVAKKPIFFIARVFSISGMSKSFLSAFLSISMLFANILITLFVLFITKASGMVGISNLGASAVLGVIMSIDAYLWLKKYKNNQNSDKMMGWIKSNLLF